MNPAELTRALSDKADTDKTLRAFREAVMDTAVDGQNGVRVGFATFKPVGRFSNPPR